MTDPDPDRGPASAARGPATSGRPRSGPDLTPERHVPVETAIAAVRAELDRHGLRAECSTHGTEGYPAFLKCPWYPAGPLAGDDQAYEPYLRYATNSGTAAGMSPPEALLHALPELVERDAFSHALLDWYVRGGRRPRLVEPGALPDELAALLDVTRDAVGGPPLLLDLTTDLAVPVFCALPPASTFLGVHGAGASLSPGYAAERALSELVQLQLNTEDLGLDLTLRRKLAQLDGFPGLARCVRLDPVELAGRADLQPARPAAYWSATGRDVPGQLAELLAAAGLGAYRFDWDAGPVPVLSVLVPGLESFWLAREGIPVLPTGRAARRFARTTG